MNRNLLAVTLAILVGCASVGTEITRDNNQIQMPHYSVVVPPNQGWRLVKPDKKSEAVELTISSNSVLFIMRFSRNYLADEGMKSWTAKQVADDYRNGEKQNMLIMGVMRGLYDLQDVVMGEEMVGDRKFYTMDYVTANSDMRQRASLYLYFPQEVNINDFFVCLYVEGLPIDASLPKSFKPDFLETLKSLKVKH
jgi:hypothetical protein